MTNTDAELRMFQAAEDGDPAEIRRAILNGADINARDENGRTALNIATQNNHAEAIITILAARQVDSLVKAGIDPSASEDMGRDSQKMA